MSISFLAEYFCSCLLACIACVPRLVFVRYESVLGPYSDDEASDNIIMVVVISRQSVTDVIVAYVLYTQTTFCKFCSFIFSRTLHNVFSLLYTHPLLLWISLRCIPCRSLVPLIYIFI